MKRFPAAAVLLTAVLLYRPPLLAGDYNFSIQFLSRDLMVLLAFSILSFRINECISVIRGLPRHEKILWMIITASAVFFDVRSHSLLNLAYVILPLCGIVCKKEILSFFPFFSFLLFWWNLLLSLFAMIFRGHEVPYGVTGNWNWSAVLTVMLLPSAVVWCFKKFSAGMSALVFSAPLIAVTLVFLPTYHSRASILCIGLLLIVLLFLCRKRSRLFIFGTLPAVLAGGVLLFTCFQDSSAAFFSREIRVNLYEAGLRLISFRPMGVGAADYENIFSGMRDIHYFSNAHAAVRSIHPHNEILYVAGILGIPSVLCFLVLIFSGIFRFVRNFDNKKISPSETGIFLFWIIGLFYSMFDLCFLAWPLDILMLFTGGFFLFPEPEEIKEKYSGKIWKITGTCLLTLCVCGCGIRFYSSFESECAFAAYRKGAPGTGIYHAGKAAPLLYWNHGLLYQLITLAYENRQFSEAMKMISRLQSTPDRDFAHIHTIKGNLLAIQGHNREAVNEYILEMRKFPHQVLPVIGIINAYGRMGNTAEVKRFRNILEEQMKCRGIDRKGLRKIILFPETDFKMRQR